MAGLQPDFQSRTIGAHRGLVKPAPPLGCDVKDKKRTVNASKAKTIRDVYRRYAGPGSVLALKRDAIVNKLRVDGMLAARNAVNIPQPAEIAPKVLLRTVLTSGATS